MSNVSNILFGENRSPSPAPSVSSSEVGQSSNLMSKTKKFVVMGTTQSGKSTFLRLIHNYAGLPIPDALAVGDGNVPCTMVPNTYDIHTKLKAFQVLDENNKPVKQEGKVTANQYQDIIDDGKYEASKDTIDLNPTVLNFRAVDTPGLDESSDKDEEHILNILDTLTKEGEITAVVFILNYTIPFSAGFKRFFHYYRSMITGLKDKFVIVHTRCSLQDRVIGSDNKDPLKNRIEAFQRECLQGEEGSKIRHFFIDCCPKQGNMTKRTPRVKYGLEYAFTYSVLTTLLLELQSMIDTPVKNLTYNKTETVSLIDEKVRRHCDGLRQGYLRALATHKEELEKYANEISSLTHELGTVKGKKKTAEDSLKAKDSTEEVEVGSDSKRDEYSFWTFRWKPTVELRVNAQFPITRLITTTLENNKVTFTPTYSDNNKSVTVKCTANTWNNAFVSITAVTLKNIMYAEEIRNLKVEIDRANQDENRLQNELNKYIKNNNDAKEKQEELQNYLEAIARLEEIVKRTSYDLEVYREIRKRNLIVKMTKDFAGNLKEFIDVLKVPSIGA